MKFQLPPGSYDTVRGVPATVRFRLVAPCSTEFILVGEIVSQGQSRLCCWDIHGHVWGSEPSDLDLQPKASHAWRTIYETGVGNWHNSLQKCTHERNSKLGPTAIQHRITRLGEHEYECSNCQEQ